MKNLESFGVQELNAKEIRETDGGFAGWVVGAFLGSFLYGIVEDWDANVAAFEEAYNAASQN